MEKLLIGRKTEQTVLEDVWKSKRAEFVAVYGRRRVGKTYLVEQFYKSKPGIYFHLTGIHKGTLKEHLVVFAKAMRETFFADLGIQVEEPRSWMQAFDILSNTIKKFGSNKKTILFFDELPWLASKKSGFKKALDFYWNTKWSKENNIILIVCGSAASWMIENIINDRGGLHNRVTLQFPVYPFSLKETFDYLNYQGNKFNQTQVLELYMALGGIPHYLEKVKSNLSAAQNISRLCFGRDGQLFHEFERLFSSLFDNADAYIELINIIATKKSGLSRNEIAIKAKLSASGGTLTERLNALEQAGFIKSFIPIGYTTKGHRYKLIDEYCLFYLTWVKPVKRQLENEVDNNYWLSKINTPAWYNWAGHAFESICLKHVAQIKAALYIPSSALADSWHYHARNKAEEGAQIDLLFDRNDGVITLCEIKYCQSPFEIDKTYAVTLQRKAKVFRERAKINKQIFLAMITSEALKKNLYSEELITSKATLEDLFE